MVRGLTPLEVQEIYAVREELEVMAVRIIPFPVSPKDIERLEELQRQHTAAVAAGDHRSNSKPESPSQLFMAETLKKSSGAVIFFAWLLFGVPLGWGVHSTVLNSLKLFR